MIGITAPMPSRRPLQASTPVKLRNRGRAASALGSGTSCSSLPSGTIACGGPSVGCSTTCAGSAAGRRREKAGEGGGAFAYRYQFKEKASDLVAHFGYAGSYREAMDNIAHAVRCKEVGK